MNLEQQIEYTAALLSDFQAPPRFQKQLAQIREIQPFNVQPSIYDAVAAKRPSLDALRSGEGPARLGVKPSEINFTGLDFSCLWDVVDVGRGPMCVLSQGVALTAAQRVAYKLEKDRRTLVRLRGFIFDPSVGLSLTGSVEEIFAWGATGWSVVRTNAAPHAQRELYGLWALNEVAEHWFARRYEWRVVMKRPLGLSMSFATDPEGAKDVFRTRDIPEGKARREALANIVRAHTRKKVDGDVFDVREHLRGSFKFTWNGLDCEVKPDQFSLDRLKKARAA